MKITPRKSDLCNCKAEYVCLNTIVHDILNGDGEKDSFVKIFMSCPKCLNTKTVIRRYVPDKNDRRVDNDN